MNDAKLINNHLPLLISIFLKILTHYFKIVILKLIFCYMNEFFILSYEFNDKILKISIFFSLFLHLLTSD